MIFRVVNWRMTRLLNLLDEAEGTNQAIGQMEKRRPYDKLLQAAEYGATRLEFSMLSCANLYKYKTSSSLCRNIDKCEARYQCTFSLAEIEQLYQH